MKYIETISELRTHINALLKEGKEIGFVPTMGYLHQGHCSLIERAAKENDVVVVSIYVNPTQFGPNEDFEKYPRDIERDLALSKDSGATLVFAPTSSEMYGCNHKTFVQVKDITNKLCGLSRPGHFQGVTTIVSKLFNMVKPHRAYFGQKDAQQVLVIKRMVEDLNMDVEIVVCPIVREEDGLAMSSRNVYLTTEERKQALILNQSLNMAREQILKGERDAERLKEAVRGNIETQPLAKIDYVSIVDMETLEDVEVIGKSTLIAMAVKFGATRLIDNIMIEV